MTEQPHPNRVQLLPWKRLPRIVDFLLIAVTAVAVLGDRNSTGQIDGRFEVLAGLVTVGLILLRRAYPYWALGLAVAIMCVLLATTSQPSVVMLAVLVTLYTVASTSAGRTALIIGATVAALFLGVTLVFLEDQYLVRELVSAFAWPALATATGMLVATSRTNMANVQERAERAEATRELEAQRRATEERLRIARDVHDVVGHHLAVINVQSGVAGHLLRSDADAAETALGVVREAAATATDELSELLSVLRADPESAGALTGADNAQVATAGSPVAPTPNLAAIDGLVESFASSGLVIEHERTGAPRPLTRSGELAAYRVIQEALTNAHKHGDGTVRLSQRFTDAGLEIVAANSCPREPEPAGYESTGDGSDGFGLVGMRERLASVGGSLTVDAGPDHFELRALVPSRGGDR